MKKYPLAGDLIAASSVRLKANPSTVEPPKEALKLYERFHRYAPRDVGSFASSLTIPTHMRKAGPARWVTYRSAKIDPATLKKPRKPVDYIHEHDPDVFTYLPDGNGYAVPAEFRDVKALVCLGICLGFSFNEDGEEIEAEGRAPFPELYASPQGGKCLYVIENRANLVAMIWGGKLRVEGRGIVG